MKKDNIRTTSLSETLIAKLKVFRGLYDSKKHIKELTLIRLESAEHPPRQLIFSQSEIEEMIEILNAINNEIKIMEE